MLHKRIDLGSIPWGLAIAGENIVKGSAVVIKLEDGEHKAYLPTTADEADAVKGFATFRIETVEGADKDHDVIKAGQRFTIYTLVKSNMWATSEFVGELVAGDELVVAHTGDDKGKLRKVTSPADDDRETLFTVFDVAGAGEGYTDPMIEVVVK